METISRQYQLVKEAREVLFQFFESIEPKDYATPVENFGRGSIRNTQTHIADAYIHWIGNFALQRAKPYIDINSIDTLAKMRDEYNKIDLLMEEFIVTYGQAIDKPIINPLGKQREFSSTPLVLFSHMITHEFHHKGQMVSMARILGYEPPDTDLIRS
ncbi:MAG: hypothetical protein KF860_11315 [Cyclobacteriaceae bacterium]|nr:hypothetical protein [Cyclobacteriaceae bacterium]